MGRTREDAAPFDRVTYRVEAQVATLTLNRPQRRNALDLVAYDQLERLLRFAGVDPEVRVVLVTGADPAFCSGDDVVALMSGEEAQAHMPQGVVARCAPTHAAMAALECEKPMIAAVDGAAVGWGWSWPSTPISASPPRRRRSRSCSSSEASSATSAASIAYPPSSVPPRRRSSSS